MRLSKEILILEEKERLAVDRSDRDYCRLQLIFCEGLHTARKAEYDVIEYKKENFDRKV